MKNYQFIFEVEEDQDHGRIEDLKPADGIFLQQKKLKQLLKSSQHKNWCKFKENESQMRKKKIRRNSKGKKQVLELGLHLKGLLEQIINESIQQANKGFVFKQLQNCQEIKSVLDKMERILIGMKSLLLSQMINSWKED
ncbi:unnamed protein product (macronuclear) [Paramecium tetraurelia]|uniref:Uncharacterized protein n=1 Tax=Paramecium tetraurelia TaxID=5888 RepID=A0BBK1_PARTE|nr:uncharacterized protein GSPATT00000353001 [Paramecium tetraurelia]CAK55918.1 unnamed protein product [Paramecium tetraurelia]|eukprot:XP_001423316.1 hypothetical protein (macronuclear) [Paramecium tetraurelia strain d4-2]